MARESRSATLGFALHRASTLVTPLRRLAVVGALAAGVAGIFVARSPLCVLWLLAMGTAVLACVPIARRARGLSAIPEDHVIVSDLGGGHPACRLFGGEE